MLLRIASELQANAREERKTTGPESSTKQVDASGCPIRNGNSPRTVCFCSDTEERFGSSLLRQSSFRANGLFESKEIFIFIHVLRELMLEVLEKGVRSGPGLEFWDDDRAVEVVLPDWVAVSSGPKTFRLPRSGAGRSLRGIGHFAALPLADSHGISIGWPFFIRPTTARPHGARP